MSNWNGLILTTKGQALKAKVEADECQLELTKFKTGNGQISGSQTLESLTDLVSPKQIITINTLAAEGSICKVGGVITNIGLEEGYEIRELGLFATDPDDGEILYAITTDNHPDYLQPDGSATVISEEFECNISMTNAANVTATIGTAGLATIGNVQTMIEAHNADSTAHADKFADYLPLTGGQITGPIETNNDEDYVPVPKTAQAHNGIYRGKDFGTISSVAQLETFLAEHGVSTGKFTDLYIGDHFILMDGTYNKPWAIAGFDTEYNKGDTAFTEHHLSLVPLENLTTSYMNSSNITTGAYYNSYMHQNVIPAVNAAMANVLGTHLKERRVLLANATDNNAKAGGFAGWAGASLSWAWYSAKAVLMSEVQVFGANICSSSLFDTGEACEKLPLYNFISPVAQIRQDFWLRAVASSIYFAYAHDGGNGGYTYASAVLGVRPLICVG